jgi:cytochrome c oxidase cbb3-type subunit 3
MSRLTRHFVRAAAGDDAARDARARRRLVAWLAWLAPLALLASVPCFTSCDREERGFHVEPPSAGTAQLTPTTDLHAGGPSTAPTKVLNEFEQNAQAMSEGQRLFGNYNCSGCHAHGGGGMGPPLIDDKWIYGSQPAQIFATIIQGRPNGMPSFEGRIPDYQVWQIVAYVRSLSGQARQDAAPGRGEEMKNSEPPNSADKQTPKQSFQPPSTEMP